MNYLSLVQRLKSESGRSGAEPTTIVGLNVGDKRLANWIADAWLEVQRRYTDWKWMRRTLTGTLTAGKGDYLASEIDAAVTNLARWQVTTDDYAVRVLSAGASQPADLVELCYDDFQARFIARTVPNGTPRYWAEGLDRKLLIGPAPDVGTMTVYADYFTRPTALTVDADVPAMPEEFHLLLVWRALVEVGSYDGAPEVEARARKNLRIAWSDLLDAQGPRVQLGFEALA